RPAGRRPTSSGPRRAGQGSVSTRAGDLSVRPAGPPAPVLVEGREAQSWRRSDARVSTTWKGAFVGPGCHRRDVRAALGRRLPVEFRSLAGERPYGEPDKP